MEEFGACWEGLEDPRTGNATLHDLHDLLMIALSSVICGGETAMDMAAFARAKEPLLRGFLRLPNGVPQGPLTLTRDGLPESAVRESLRSLLSSWSIGWLRY